LLGIQPILGGFSTISVRFHVHRKAAVGDVFYAANVLILPRRSARNFRARSGNAHPPLSFVRWRVVVGTRKVAPLHMNHVHVVVSCWMWRVGGGRTCVRYHISIVITFVRFTTCERGTGVGRMLVMPPRALHWPLRTNSPALSHPQWNKKSHPVV